MNSTTTLAQTDSMMQEPACQKSLNLLADADWYWSQAKVYFKFASNERQPIHLRETAAKLAIAYVDLAMAALKAECGS